MGGVPNIWQNSKQRLGFSIKDKTSIPKFEEQKFGDGKIEILTFKSQIAMGLERIIPGRARKIAQQEGNIMIEFQQNQKKGKLVKTYFQIDGEYYSVTSPKQCEVQLTDQIPNGKIQVIVNNQNKQFADFFNSSNK
eukprot:TRINITY_DN9418_c0_g1_i1.p3 TRINITY_DN9418_c0_g1~~TRINITY_DN9418_c0_g1_i1.p3  ORF type:complete len:136 (-),score=22.57 TRINITY_DN9418_c0_g1_i1:34-441(-)